MISVQLKTDKIESMRRAYPSLRFISDENDVLTWEGWVQPLLAINELDALLDDLEHDRDVIIDRGDACGIVHHTECKIEHGVHRLSHRITSPTRLFKIRIRDFQDGRLPRADVLEPKITENLRRHNWGSTGICAFAPWEYPWDLETSQIIEFVDHSLIWLLKWNVFAQTDKWLGRETSHDRRFLLNTIRPSQRCYCGLGKSYENCHRRLDGYELYRENWLFVEAWLERHNRDLKHLESLSTYLRPLISRNAAKGANC